MKQPKTYYDLINCKTRIAVFQGGTRSGKTFSIITVLCQWCYENQNAGYLITVVRKSFPSLRASVMRDFLFILDREGWYDERNHNKTENTYALFGNTIEFISIDQPQKIRGATRQFFFANEANELDLETYRQLALRTSNKLEGPSIILDYNPSDEYSYIYDAIIPREDASFYKSTYLDNPYLNQETIDEIERLKDTDEYYWTVYGLGERGISRETIFRSDIYTELPEHAKFLAWGLDWGFANDPTALVKVYEYDNAIYIEQFLYSGGLTNSDIADKMTQLGITRHEEIIADSSEPKSIEEIHRMNFNIKPAKKGPDSVRIGIDLMRRKKIYVKETSLDAQKEFRNYKWMTDKNGKVLNTPRDDWNHCVDAVRYVCLNKLLRRTGKYFVQ